MLQFYFSLRQLRLIKYSFFIHSTCTTSCHLTYIQGLILELSRNFLTNVILGKRHKNTDADKHKGRIQLKHSNQLYFPHGDDYKTKIDTYHKNQDQKKPPHVTEATTMK